MSTTSHARDWWVAAASEKPFSCTISSHSLKEIMAFAESEGKKFVLMPRTEKHGFYSLVFKENAATSVFAESQEKCEFGVEAVKLQVATAYALTQSKKQIGTKYKTKKEIPKLFLDAYNELWDTKLSMKEFNKLVDKYDIWSEK